MKVYFLGISLFLLSAPVAAQKTQMAIPATAELSSYPLMKGPLSVQEIAKYGLHPVRLDSAWTGYNWYRDKGRFVYETLPKGTLVLVDSLGEVRYKEDCGNRLASLVRCPQCGVTSGGRADTVARAGMKSDSSALGLGANIQEPMGFFERLARGIWSGLGGILKTGGWAFASLLGLLITPLLAYLLYKLWQQRNQGSRGVSGTNPSKLVSTPASSGSPAPVASVPGATTTAAPVVSTPVSTAPTPSGASPSVSSPTAPSTQFRRFVNYSESRGSEPSMLRFNGVSDVRFEEKDGVTTIRFTT